MGKFRIGDKVWDINYGHGKVIEIEPDDYYAVRVFFDGVEKEVCYTQLGKERDDSFYQTLMFKQLDILPEHTDRPLDELIEGKVYLVWDNCMLYKDATLKFYTGYGKKFTNYKTLVGNKNNGAEYDNFELLIN